MENINVTKIMAEIEAEVQKKMSNQEYVRDLNELQRLGEKNFIEDKHFTDMYAMTFLTKRTTIPRSMRTGVISRIANFFILKLYHVITKMFNPVFMTQEKLNQSLVEEVVSIKEDLGISKKSEGFPYEEFYKIYGESHGIAKDEAGLLNGYLEGKKTVGILGLFIKPIFDYAQETNAKHIIGVDPTVSDNDLITEKRVLYKNEDYIEFLKGRTNFEFDSMILFDLFEHFSVEHVFAILSEVRRVMAPGGDLLVRAYNPEPEGLEKSIYDPRFKRFIHRKLLEFMLEYFDFGNIKYIENNLTQNGKKYVLVTQKKKK